MKRFYWLISLPIVPRFIKRFVEMKYWNRVADVKRGDAERQKWNEEKVLQFRKSMGKRLYKSVEDGIRIPENFFPDSKTVKQNSNKETPKHKIPQKEMDKWIKVAGIQ